VSFGSPETESSLYPRGSTYLFRSARREEFIEPQTVLVGYIRELNANT
jgi:hypothetical protein